jgi:hypothetical protein
VGVFFIDYETGSVATQRQLVEARVAREDELPPRPWHRIDGPSDASTLWYAVMRKRTRGIFIGALCIRHTERHASLGEAGWDEVPVEEIGVSPDAARMPPS